MHNVNEVIIGDCKKLFERPQNLRSCHKYYYSKLFFLVLRIVNILWKFCTFATAPSPSTRFALSPMFNVSSTISRRRLVSNNFYAVSIGVKIRDGAKCGDGEGAGAVRCGKNPKGETFTVILIIFYLVFKFYGLFYKNFNMPIIPIYTHLR